MYVRSSGLGDDAGAPPGPLRPREPADAAGDASERRHGAVRAMVGLAGFQLGKVSTAVRPVASLQSTNHNIDKKILLSTSAGAVVGSRTVSTLQTSVCT